MTRTTTTRTTSIPIDYASRSVCDVDTGPVRGVLAAAILGAAMVTATLLWAVESRIGDLRAGYEIHKLQRASVALRRERAELEVEVAMLQRPERLARIAKARLGLVPTPASRVLRLPPLKAPVTTSGEEDSHESK